MSNKDRVIRLILLGGLAVACIVYFGFNLFNLRYARAQVVTPTVLVPPDISSGLDVSRLMTYAEEQLMEDKLLYLRGLAGDVQTDPNPSNIRNLVVYAGVVYTDFWQLVHQSGGPSIPPMLAQLPGDTLTPTNVCNPAWQYCENPQTFTPAPVTTCDPDFEICGTPNTRVPYPPPPSETPHPYLPPDTPLPTGYNLQTLNAPFTQQALTQQAETQQAATATPTFTSTPTRTSTPTSTPSSTPSPSPTQTLIPSVPPPPTPEFIAFSIGWNLISLPDPAGYNAETLLQAINAQGGHCLELVRWYRNAWNVHYRGIGSNMFSISRYEGYFVYCTVTSTFVP